MTFARSVFRISTVAVIALLCASASTGCGRGANSSTAKSAPRGTVAVPLIDRVVNPAVVAGEERSPKVRIVCAAPSLTEICCALGLRDQIVGRTRFCTYPPGIEAVPSIGALIDTNVETLLALKPDLLLVSGRSRAMTERFDSLNIRYETLPDGTLADIYASITRVGELSGRPKTAAALVREIQRDLDAIAKHFSYLPPTRVLLVVGVLSDPPTPPHVAGKNSFYGELLTLGNQRNIISFDDRLFGPVSLEFIVNRDPEVILELDPDGRLRPNGDDDAQRVWSLIGPLKPVERHRIHVIQGPEHYLPGPRIAQTMYALLDAIASSNDN